MNSSKSAQMVVPFNILVHDNKNNILINSVRAFVITKMPQSGVGSMQGKDTGNMPSAVCASSMNKSLDPTPT